MSEPRERSVAAMLAFGVLIAAAILGLIALLLRQLGWSYWGAE